MQFFDGQKKRGEIKNGEGWIKQCIKVTKLYLKKWYKFCYAIKVYIPWLCLSLNINFIQLYLKYNTLHLILFFSIYAILGRSNVGHNSMLICWM